MKLRNRSTIVEIIYKCYENQNKVLNSCWGFLWCEWVGGICKQFMNVET